MSNFNVRNIHVQLRHDASGADVAGSWVWACDPDVITIGDVDLSVSRCGDLDVSLSDAAGQRVALVRRRCIPAADDEDERIEVETFSGDGTLRQRLRFAAGDLSDGPGGEPASEAFDEVGRLLSRSFYSNGVLQDGCNGEPGWTDYFPDTGRERLVQRFLAGALNDGANGEPAYLELAPDGTVVEESHFRRGLAITPRPHLPGSHPTSEPRRPGRPRRSPIGAGRVEPPRDPR